MNTFLVDTNAQVRLIASDDEKKFQTILKLIEKVDNGEYTLLIPVITIGVFLPNPSNRWNKQKQQPINRLLLNS